jgi:hypothetical protein
LPWFFGGRWLGVGDGPKLTEMEKTKQMEKAHLENFDDLDFNVYTGQEWDQLGKSHSKDITVHWPDGRMTKGIDAHKGASDQDCSGEWTSVMSIMEGTFSQPKLIGDGKTISPTGKPFKVTLVTIGHWKDGVMDEEWLMWDNQTFMKQIGLVP